ncbi:ABC-2 type transport system permease protein [Kribbella antiqua]|uniref:Transport permease protein n=1 Tax=Kribbella antiqua TaxID=2512217 RepID=A0A4V2S500_9ACTN|nr:ABC transporter permease [Kribbella antiqua]TCO50270.1 ABC-2 type transport system permease protein [Kribbella antiqua]
MRHQFRYDWKVFWRSPSSVFFAFVLPIMFLIIFVTVFGNQRMELADGELVRGSTYYLPAIVTLGLIQSTFANQAVSLTASRERGLLKRLRTTPLPTSTFMAGRLITSAAAAILLVVVLTAIGRFVYGVAVPTTTIAAGLLALVVGTFTFSALAFAVSTAIPSQDAAVPITNAVTLPLYFISGVFIPQELIPSGVREVAQVFPVKRLYDAFLTVFDPATSGAGLELTDLGIVAAWGLAATTVAISTFRWAPRTA